MATKKTMQKEEVRVYQPSIPFPQSLKQSKMDSQIPLFLGRPFLATEASLIDVKKGELTLRVGIEEVHFNLNQRLKQHDFEKTQCIRVETMMIANEEKNDNCLNENSFDESIFNSLYMGDREKE